MSNLVSLDLPYILRPNTASDAVNAYLEKHNKAKKPPAVNLPALARRDGRFMECWRADPGYVFISSDFSSLEPGISAEFSKDPFYQYATFGGIGKRPYFNEHGVLMIDDVYLMVASVMPSTQAGIREHFSKKEICDQWLIDSEVVKSLKTLKPLRTKAKPACLGFNYGMGPKKFVKQAYDAGDYVTHAEAKAMYQAYWDLFKELRVFTQKLEYLIKRDKFLVNPFGYRLTTEAHKGYNAYIQSSASGVVDLLCLKLFPKMPRSKFVTLVHDEVIYQVREEDIELARKLQDEALEEVNAMLKFSIPMRLGFTVARTFKEIK